jgi:hypothetical protein
LARSPAPEPSFPAAQTLKLLSLGGEEPQAFGVRHEPRPLKGVGVLRTDLTERRKARVSRGSRTATADKAGMVAALVCSSSGPPRDTS